MSLHPVSILFAVAQAFGLAPLEVAGRDRRHRCTLPRQVWVYLLVQFLPQAERLPARGGKTRRAGDQDGNIKPVARIVGWHPSGVRYAIRRVEDLRDDRAFDARITALEAELKAS